MGPNACGKSTLAKLLAGLMLPSQGRLEILGNDQTESEGRSGISGRVGIVFQSPDDQMVAATVEREIAFGLENRGVPSTEIRTKVDALLTEFNLQRFAQRSPFSLSGGEKQLVALASVLAMELELLILDEVTSLLDPEGREQVSAVVGELKGQITTVLITQFPAEALIGDRLVIMKNGSVFKDDHPRDLFWELSGIGDTQVDIPLAFRLLRTVRP